VDAQGRGHIYENANSPTSLMTFENGNIGIGTTNTGSFKLAVEGKVGAREFKVTQASPWPDYVFATNYVLMPIEQVAAYIKVNKHLPGIPSAKEIEENQGFDIGATQI
ncbi:hypothetical protein, partial [Escherichia coli]|uniref:hypothetical protein n=1 Tax=Escherichia coli TaxID=562 RepID=UPI001961DF04